MLPSTAMWMGNCRSRRCYAAERVVRAVLGYGNLFPQWLLRLVEQHRGHRSALGITFLDHGIRGGAPGMALGGTYAVAPVAAASSRAGGRPPGSRFWR